MQFIPLRHLSHQESGTDLISGESDFRVSGDGSLGYWSCETSHSSFQLSNSNGIFDDESLEVSAGDGRCGHRSLATSHSSSHNSGIYHSSNYGIGGSRY